MSPNSARTGGRCGCRDGGHLLIRAKCPRRAGWSKATLSPPSNTGTQSTAGTTDREQQDAVASELPASEEGPCCLQTRIVKASLFPFVHSRFPIWLPSVPSFPSLFPFFFCFNLRRMPAPIRSGVVIAGRLQRTTVLSLSPYCNQSPAYPLPSFARAPLSPTRCDIVTERLCVCARPGALFGKVRCVA